MRSLVAFLLFLVFAISTLASPVAAAAPAPITVGEGTPASCTESALKEALTAAQVLGGGTIHFECGALPVRVSLTDAADDGDIGPVFLALPNNTTIDGEGRVTLAGLGGGTLIFVDHDTSAVLKNISVTHASLYPVALNEGTLVIQNSMLAGNPQGGDIGNSGTLRIDNSRAVSINVSNEGALTVKNSVFSDGGGPNSSGAIVNGGVAVVKNSTFSNNSTDAFFGAAGAILNFGALTVEGSVFVRNRGVVGGAIWNLGTLTVATTSFLENSATFGGGAISSNTLLGPPRLTVSNSEFVGNSSFIGSGGGIAAGGETVITNSYFVGNDARRYGGAIYAEGTLIVSKSDILDNIAGLDGGGIYSCCGGVALNRTVVTGNIPNDVVP